MEPIIGTFYRGLGNNEKYEVIAIENRGLFNNLRCVIVRKVEGKYDEPYEIKHFSANFEFCEVAHGTAS